MAAVAAGTLLALGLASARRAAEQVAYKPVEVALRVKSPLAALPQRPHLNRGRNVLLPPGEPPASKPAQTLRRQLLSRLAHSFAPGRWP